MSRKKYELYIAYIILNYSLYKMKNIIIILTLCLSIISSINYTNALSEREVIYPEDELRIDNYFSEIHEKIQYFTNEKQKITYQKIYDIMNNYKESNDITDLKIKNLINYIISKTNRKLLTLDWNISFICAYWWECDADENKIIIDKEEQNISNSEAEKLNITIEYFYTIEENNWAEFEKDIIIGKFTLSEQVNIYEFQIESNISHGNEDVDDMLVGDMYIYSIDNGIKNLHYTGKTTFNSKTKATTEFFSHLSWVWGLQKWEYFINATIGSYTGNITTELLDHAFNKITPSDLDGTLMSSVDFK